MFYFLAGTIIFANMFVFFTPPIERHRFEAVAAE